MFCHDRFGDLRLFTANIAKGNMVTQSYGVVFVWRAYPTFENGLVVLLAITE